MKKQQDKFEHYIVELETLTPLHIGSGVTLTKDIDFFVEKGEVGKVNPEKILGIILQQKESKEIDELELINQWANLIETNGNIRETGLLQEVSLQKLCDEILEVRENVDVTGQLDEFIRNQYTKNPIIPGSSLKGAIRTAYLTTAITKDYYNNKIATTIIDTLTEIRKIDREIKKLKRSHYYNKNKLDDLIKRRKSLINKLPRETQKLINQLTIFEYDNIQDKDDKQKDKFDAKKDIFKFVRISDGEGTIEELTVDNFYIINKQKNNKWTIKTRRAKEVFSGNIKMHLTIQKDFWNKNKLRLKNIDDFIKMLNNHFRNLVENEYKFLKNQYVYFKDEGINIHLEYKLERIKKAFKTLQKEEAIIRMSHGSGWKFMTGDWAENNKILPIKDWYSLVGNVLRPPRKRKGKPPKIYPPEIPFPKTRRLTSEYKFPGFVKLKFKKI